MQLSSLPVFIMSIAVSAVVKSSRLLRQLVGGMAGAALAMTSMMLFDLSGDPSAFWRSMLGLAVFPIPLLAISRTNWFKKSLHIDISGNGQITVEEDNAESARRRQEGFQPAQTSRKLARLMPDSTLWPHLLLLRLQVEDQGIKNLLVLPDCMDESSFRALAVACRWIAARNDPIER